MKTALFGNLSMPRTAVVAALVALLAEPTLAQAPPVPQSGAFPALLKQLRDPDPDARMEAATLLGRLRAQAKPAVPALIEALTKDADGAVRMKAADALGQIAQDGGTAVPALVKSLDDPDVRVTTSALYALSAFGAEARPAVPEIKKRLAHANPNVNWMATRALVRLREEIPAALVVVHGRLNDPDIFERMGAGRVLVEAVGAKEAAPLLRKLTEAGLAHHDIEARRSAVRMLQHLGAEAVPRLAELARSPKEKGPIRRAAIGVLRQMGETARPALPALKEIAATRDRLAWEAAGAVQAIETGKGWPHGRAKGNPGHDGDQDFQ